jgi:MFS family permease
VLGTLVFSIFSLLMSDAQFVAWGWRLPFLFSIVLVIVGLWIRFTIAESPEFQKIKDEKQEVKMPIIDAIRMYPKNILLAMGARFAENGFFYIYATSAGGEDTGVALPERIECVDQNLGVRPSDQLGAAPFQTRTRGGALANREGAQGPGGMAENS